MMFELSKQENSAMYFLLFFRDIPIWEENKSKIQSKGKMQPTKNRNQ